MIAPASRPTLFFDRDVGKRLPEVLARLRLPIEVEFLRDHFAQDTPDEVWMPEIGRRGWIIIGHDRRHHLEPSERAAIIDYRIRCFYLWGGSEQLWEKVRCFLRAFELILDAIVYLTPPFILDVLEDGQLEPISLS